MATNDFTPNELENEKWKNVPGYAGLYQVSNLGRVRSWHKRSGGALLSAGTDKIGYSFVILYYKARCTPHRVHRLVADRFISPCPAGLEVNHKDGDKSNNRASNLEYITHRQNILHAIGNGAWPSHAGEKSGNAKLTNEQVREIRRFVGNGLMTYKEAARKYRVTKVNISMIVNRKSWKHID